MTANIIDGCGGVGNVLLRRVAEQGNRSEGRREDSLHGSRGAKMESHEET